MIIGDNIKHLAYQIEKCPDTERLHLQLYLEVKNPVTMGYVKAKIPGGDAHCERRAGSARQAWDYCTKEESRHAGPWKFYEEPKAPKRGQRTDLEAVKVLIDDGKSMFDVADSDFVSYVRFYKGFERYATLRKSRQRATVPSLHIFWGPSGTGKSRRAFDIGGDSSYWMSRPNNSAYYCDGYDGQRVFVIDEFYGWLPRDFLQRLSDRYPFQLPLRGGSVQSAVEQIIITSNRSPEDWWKVGFGEPLKRRIREFKGEIVYMGNDEFPTSEDYILSADYRGGMVFKPTSDS